MHGKSFEVTQAATLNDARTMILQIQFGQELSTNIEKTCKSQCGCEIKSS